MPRHSRILSFAFATALAGLVLAAAPSAHADRGAGALQLGAGSTLFAIENLPDPGYSTIQYGLSPTTYLVGLHGGYQVTDNILIGVQLLVGGLTIDTSFGNSDTFAFTILPRFEYLIDISDTLMAYVGAEVGFALVGDPGANPEDIFKAGGIGGLRIFAESSFSIDGELNFSFVHHPDSANAGVQVGLNLVFSGWIGGSGGGGGGGGAEPAPVEDTWQPPPPSNDAPPPVADPEAGVY